MMDVEAAASVLVSKTLDRLGYSHEMVKYRQQLWGRFGHTLGIYNVNVVGSKREGLARNFESDTDFLFHVRNIFCTTRSPSLYNKNTHLTVLMMDRNGTYPGYTRLICVKLGTRFNGFLYEALTQPINGNIFLSSDSWRRHKGVIDLDSIYMDMDLEGFDWDLKRDPDQGPSNPASSPSTDIHFDSVAAILCDCPDILQPWLNRVRKHTWPSAEIIEKISTLEAHVVPVGFKGSPTQFLEWRICFTKAETKLIQSLNDCQVKLLILLKMIAKNSLKPVCPELTSYVMKNFVLWIAELYPPAVFTENNLLTILKASLRFLRQCLIRRYLPSYMIPERNLLVYLSAQTNIPGHSAGTKVCDVIDTILNEGPRMLLRCGKIRNAWNLWYSFPERFYLFSNTCIKLEIVSMLFMLCNMITNRDSRAKQQIRETISAILNEFWLHLLYTGPDGWLIITNNLISPWSFVS